MALSMKACSPDVVTIQRALEAKLKRSLTHVQYNICTVHDDSGS